MNVENEKDPTEDINKSAARNTGDSVSADDTTENDITPEERELLDGSFEDEEEHDLHNAALDSADEDGEPLNEKTSENDPMGEDLDIPGAELDDEDESIGDEDEENNGYSMADNQ